jgi:hypothetical protein
MMKNQMIKMQLKTQTFLGDLYLHRIQRVDVHRLYSPKYIQILFGRTIVTTQSRLHAPPGSIGSSAQLFDLKINKINFTRVGFVSMVV